MAPPLLTGWAGEREVDPRGTGERSQLRPWTFRAAGLRASPLSGPRKEAQLVCQFAVAEPQNEVLPGAVGAGSVPGGPERKEGN